MIKLSRLFLVIILVGLAFYLWGFLSLYYGFFPSALVRTSLSFLEEPPHRILHNTATGAKRVGISSQFEIIRSLPYVGLVENKNKTTSEGVSFIDSEFSYEGLNLYTTGRDDEAFLIDMKGKLLHYWRYPREKIIWHSELSDRSQSYRGWRSFYAFNNLDLLVIYDYLGLAKIDKNSRLKWVFKGGCHHDLWLTQSGEIYVLGFSDEKKPELYGDALIVCDYIIILDHSGTEKKRLSILDLISNSPYSFLLPNVANVNESERLDILHTNSIQVFDGSLEYKDKRLFKKGNILISVRNLSTLFIIDPAKQEVIWAWGPSNISFQHKARLLGNGNILMFDNGLKRSRILELDPIKNKIFWICDRKNGETFFTNIYGSTQRLPNGNTLGVVSKSQTVFEINPDHRVVWSFSLPLGEDEKAPVIYEMQRYPLNHFKESFSLR